MIVKCMQCGKILTEEEEEQFVDLCEEHFDELFPGMLYKLDCFEQGINPNPDGSPWF